MKKFLPFLLLLMTSLFIFSCKDDDNDVQQVQVDYPTVYDYQVNLKQNKEDYFLYYDKLPYTILNQDYVMIYRRNKNNPAETNPIWEPLPKTFFFDFGTMDYTYNFTKGDFQIDLNADFDLTVRDNDFRNKYLTSQTFRVVLVPAVFGNKNVDRTDLSKMTYEEVIAKYKIDDSKVGKL